MIKEYQVAVTTTGGAGVAGGTGVSELPINGLILAIHVNYHASAPATTTVDVDEVGGVARKILDLAAANTDAEYRPRQVASTNAGAAQTAYTEMFALAGRKLQVTVALSDALTNAVVVTILVADDSVRG